MIKFMNWWFAETWKLPHGFIVLLAYLIFIRTILIYNCDINYMIMDGIVFSIIACITVVGPELKNMFKEIKKLKE